MPLQSAALQSAVRAAVDQWMYFWSFPNFNELSCRDPPILRCRRRRVQQWILQKLQDAPAEYRGAGSHVCNNGSLNAAVQRAMCAAKNPHSRIYKPLTSNLKDPHFSHPIYASLALFRGTIAGHQIWQFNITRWIFFYTHLACRVYDCVCVIIWVRKLILVTF